MQPRSSRLIPGLVFAVAAFAVAACGMAGASGSPGVSPSIAHATGAADLILRFDEVGGFVGPGFFATQAPIFSLYGDGTAIFRDPRGPAPSPEGDIIRGIPYRTARLTEEHVQDVLAFAIGPGGLGAAASHYDQPIADAPTAVFTIATSALTKSVEVNGLGIDVGQGANAAILGQLETLATRLQTFRTEATAAVLWSPDRYRGILTDDPYGTTRIKWPWGSMLPQEFVQRTEPGAPPFPIRTMTPAEVAKLGLTGIEGGLQGVALVMPSDQILNFRLRPLLPDERY